MDRSRPQSSVAASLDTAAGNEKYVLGAGLNSDLPTQLSNWTVGSASEPLRRDGNDALVKFTLNGDFNLDGTVNQSDNSILQGDFNSSGNDFIDGDTNGETKQRTRID